MNSRYEVTLNGISLESLSPSILIIDVNYEPPQYEIETYTIVKRQGARISRKHKEKAAVAIRFQVRAYDTVERQGIIQSIVSWARNGGDLRINDRPGQMLICVCDQLPAVESVRGWTEEMTIAFAAYAIPYWQSVEETVATLSLSAGSSSVVSKDDVPYTDFTLYVPGNAPYNYLGMKWTGGTGHRTEDFNVINTSRDDGEFKVEGAYVDSGGGYQVPTIYYRAVEYDEDAVEKVYEHYRAYNATEDSDRSLEKFLQEADEVIVNCGQNNALKVRYYGIEDTHALQTKYIGYACEVEFHVRGLWE